MSKNPTGNEGSPSQQNNPSNTTTNRSPGNTPPAAPHRPIAIRYRPIRPRPSHMAPPPTPTNPPPPPMGVPGVSAFRPFVQRSPPSGRPSSSGHHNVGASSSGVGGSFPPAGFGFHAIPVGGVGGGALRIGGSRNPVARKRGVRVRQQRPVAPPPPPPPPPSPPKPPAAPVDGGERPVPFVCSVCGRVFVTSKAMFGHMRSHPERGWRGALPPPVFNAAEELAALNPAVLNSGPGVEQVPAAGDGGEEAAAPQEQAGEEVAAQQEEQGGDVAAAPQEEQGGAAEENVKYHCPDLNRSPPPENDEE